MSARRPASSAAAGVWYRIRVTPQLPADVHRAWTADLSAAQLYRILQLRVDVFVVEQRCPYPELDGRDMEETTRHFWIEEPDGRVVSCLRLLEDGDVFRIGRVCTAADARGKGLSSKLMRAAVAEVAGAPAVLSAQVYAVDFYRSFGFEPEGEQYLEDGIPHIDMRRPAR